MTFVDMAGVSHILGIGAQSPAAINGESNSQFMDGCSTPSTLQPAGDGQVVGTLVPNAGSFYLGASSPTSAPFAVIDKDGTVYQFPGGFSQQDPGVEFYPMSVTDRNGNSIISFPSGASSYQDSVGRLGPIIVGSTPSSPSQSGSTTITTLNSNSSSSSFSLSYTANWNTNPDTVSYSPQISGVYMGTGFACEAIPATVTGTRTILSSLSMPNSNSYVFHYGNDNSDASVRNGFGLLNQIIYPDGGWVKYTWQLPPNDSHGNTVYTEMLSMLGQTLSPTNSTIPTPFDSCFYQYQTPVLTKRQVSYDGTNVAQTQTFQYSTNWSISGGVLNGWSSKTTTVTTTDKIAHAGAPSMTVYTYIPIYAASQPLSTGNTANQIPVESTIQYYDWGQTSTPSKTVTKTWKDQFNMTSETTLINATGQVTETTYKYGPANCTVGLLNQETSSLLYLLEEDEWDYGLLTAATAQNPTVSGVPSPTRKTIYGYNCFGPLDGGVYSSYQGTTSEFPGISLPPRVSRVLVESGSGTVLSAMQYGYDGSSLLGSSSYAAKIRGNVTSVTRCVTPSASCTSGPTVTYTYDGKGQPATMTDACGNGSCKDISGSNHTTQFSFSDSAATGAGNPAGNSDAYLTQITLPVPSSGATLTKSFQYNYLTGYLTQATDENGQYTTYAYGGNPSQCSQQDKMERLTQVTYPDHGTTEYCYVDTYLSPTVTTYKEMTLSPAQWESSESMMDGMEHVVQAQLSSDPNGSDTVRSTYDGEGLVFETTNPERTTPSPTDGTTYHYYDAFGRPIETKEQDTSLLQWCYDGIASSPAVSNCGGGQLGSIHRGTWVNYSDEANNEWQRTYDVFADLLDVIEPNGAAQTASMETDYAYDVLKNLLSINQLGISGSPAGTRTRSFSYDGLSRLVAANNPETGSIGYMYDLNGNVQTKTDVRGVVTQFGYDVLNRILTKSYLNDGSGTPLSCYKYDTSSASCSQTSCNWLGRLTASWTVSASSGGSSCSGATLTQRLVNAYDAMGRLLNDQQFTIASQAKSASYTPAYAYNLMGNLVSSTDGYTPAGGGSPCPGAPTPCPTLTFTNLYDTAGHLQSVTSNWVDSTHPSSIFVATPNVSLPSYTPAGALQNAMFANSGLILTRTYDPRLRIVSESDSQSATRPATGGSATVTIIGNEQSTSN